MRWDPSQYARYASERSRPFFDLTERIAAEAPRRVVDAGCGSGELTAVLAQRWPDATVEGFDSSAEMVAAAQQHATAALTFRVEDVRDWTMPPDTDVLVSNAALQWVPRHVDLLATWAAQLPRGGWLAVQVPGNFDAPSHRIMRELAESPRWAPALSGVLRHHHAVATPEWYAEVLLDAGLVADVWETTYLHVLSGTDPVLEWVRGTGLRPVLSALDEANAQLFEREYAARLREAYPATPNGTVFPFRRIFLVGSRP
ncbi:MAG TPA: trans-aconitate 2-methyltransferase [Jatrophihabitantaceae bacterium]|nr:trans-aconitate 2-methyltransferase [Jatrophihabitantaceae bacterium]